MFFPSSASLFFKMIILFECSIVLQPSKVILFLENRAVEDEHGVLI